MSRHPILSSLIFSALCIIPLFANGGEGENRIFIKIAETRIIGAEKNTLTGIEAADMILLEYGVIGKQKAFMLGKKPDNAGLSRVFSVELPVNTDLLKVTERLNLIDGIDYAEPAPERQLFSLKSKDNGVGFPEIDYLPNDPLYSMQWFLPSVYAPAAWDYEKGDASVIIAIVDNGVDWDHPDLQSQIWSNPGEIPYNGVDDDNNGFIDDIRGWDFVHNDNDPSNFGDPDTSSGEFGYHGTHVAGITAAATGNGVGGAGMAPDCKIMPVKAGIHDLISYSVSGIIYAYENGAKVINCSYGKGGWSSAEEDAIDNATAAGALVVAAAGNDGIYYMNYPAANENALSVAALDVDNGKSGFSTYHSSVDICAPGSNIFSTWVTNSGSPTYGFAGGTSMASPLTAGVAALLFSKYPIWTPDQVRVKLQNSSDDIYSVNPEYSGYLGSGKVNAYRAVGESLPGIRFLSFEIDDSEGGDGDNIPEPGDSLSIIVTLGNAFQDAFDVIGEISTSHSQVDIFQTTSDFGDISTGGSGDNSDNPFRVYLGSMPEGEEVNFVLNITTEDNYTFLLNFTMIVTPPYANHNVGEIIATITNFGAFGYQEFPYNTNSTLIGEGFRFDGGDNVLYHGSMALGLNQNRVCSSIYRESQFPQKFEWADEEPIVMVSPGVKSDQESSVTYHDHSVFVAIMATTISVEQKSYAFNDDPDDDFIIMEYYYTNTSDTSFTGFLAGLFMDWDIGPNLNYNSVGYSAVEGTGYMYIYDTNSPIYGVTPLTHPLYAHRAIDNELYTYGSLGLNDPNLFQFMDGSIGSASALNGDYSHVTSVGPFDIAPDSTVTVAFAIVAGSNLNDYLVNSGQAKIMYAAINGLGALSSFTSGNNMTLGVPNPNPFNQTISFTLSMIQSGRVEIKVFDVLGRTVDEVHQGILPVGETRFNWSAGEMSSGVYFLQAISANQNNVHKLILLK